jgi:uncharacterized membrane protein YfcA
MPEIDVTFCVAFLIVIGAGATAGLAGFGFSIVSVPILLLLFDPATVITLNKVLTLGTIWVILIGAWGAISWYHLRRIVPFALIGLFVGVTLLRVLDDDAIKLLAGVVVIFFALLLLRGGVKALPERPWMAPIAGLVSGTLSTSIGMSGPPVVLLFTVLAVPVPVFRATSVCYFLLSDLIGFPTLIVQGIVTRDDVILALLLAPAAVIGRLIGSWLVPFVSPLAFRRATLGLLLVTGAIAVVNVLGTSLY